MMTVHNEPVPYSKFKMWHDILVATGGRYLTNPYVLNDVVRVDYEPGDYKEQQTRWNQLNVKVVERMKNQPYRKAWNRIKLMLRF